MSTEVVDRVFDRLGASLPNFVPGLPSLKFGIQIGSVVGVVALVAAAYVHHQNRHSTLMYERHLWVAVLMVGTYVAAKSADAARDIHYQFASVALNMPYFAVRHWLRELKHAVA